MIKRIIDISEPAYLHVQHQQLLIDKNKTTIGQVPIEDLGVLILQHPAIVITQQTIILCQKNKVVIVFCDNKHLPYSIILPIGEGHTLHNKILKQQLSISEPIKKRLWKQIVVQKIQQQAKTLALLNKNTTRLDYLAKQVKTGDTTNTEAVAAQHYWKSLFGKAFKRDPELEGINLLLNYGYAIIRAMIARGICGAGLHPALGLFHSNQYNSLCLADDLMEVFRPWVDSIVYNMYQQSNLEISRENKQPFLELLSIEVTYKQKKMPFMVSIPLFMAELKRCYLKETQVLTYPKLMGR